MRFNALEPVRALSVVRQFLFQRKGLIEGSELIDLWLDSRDEKHEPRLAADMEPVEASAGKSSFSRQPLDGRGAVSDRLRVDPCIAGIVVVAFDEARGEQRRVLHRCPSL